MCHHRGRTPSYGTIDAVVGSRKRGVGLGDNVNTLAIVADRDFAKIEIGRTLFWDELFVLGAGKSMPSEKQFKRSMDGERAKLTNADSRLAVLSFSVNIASGLIRQTTVSPHAEGASPYLTWEYTDFGSLGSKSFPTWHFLTISGGSKPVKATLSLSSLKNDSGWETRTETPGSSYTEVTVEKLMSRIMSLTR